MTDFLGYGKEKRRQGNLDILAGRLTFRYVERYLKLFLHSGELIAGVEMVLRRCWTASQPTAILLSNASKSFGKVSLKLLL